MWPACGPRPGEPAATLLTGMPVCRIAVNTFCELMGAEIACDEPSVVEYVTRFMRVPGAHHVRFRLVSQSHRRVRALARALVRALPHKYPICRSTHCLDSFQTECRSKTVVPNVRALWEIVNNNSGLHVFACPPGVSASRRGTHLSDGCNSRGPPRDSVVATGATPAAATASTLGAAGTETPATQLDAAAPDPGSQNSPRVLRGGGCAVVVSEASCLMRNSAMDESSGGSSGVTGAVPGAATGATPAAATASTLGAAKTETPATALFQMAQSIGGSLV